MKEKFHLVVFVLILAVDLNAQNVSDAFTFSWTSGEYSSDMSIQESIWTMSKNGLTYNQKLSGRAEWEMPRLTGDKKLPLTIKLDKSQKAELDALIVALTTENSLSLLPKDFQGSMEDYSLSFGDVRKTVSLALPKYTIDALKQPSDSREKPISPADRSVILLKKFEALRDFLLGIELPVKTLS